MPDELTTAIGYHQQGRLDQAARLYESILARQADHADVLQLLGVAAFQQGHPERAVDLTGRAIAVNPSVRPGDIARSFGKISYVPSLWPRGSHPEAAAGAHGAARRALAAAKP